MDTANTKKPRRNYATDYVVHAYAPVLGADCKKIRARDRMCSERREDVTCKRCLSALAKLVVVLVALLGVACASPRQAFTIGMDEGSGPLDEALEAAAMWNGASDALYVAVSGQPNGDVNLVWKDLPSHLCARTFYDGTSPRIELNRTMSDKCKAVGLVRVIAHELGHYMAASTSHLGSGNIMAEETSGLAEAPTQADVGYATQEAQ